MLDTTSKKKRDQTQEVKRWTTVTLQLNIWILNTGGRDVQSRVFNSSKQKVAERYNAGVISETVMLSAATLSKSLKYGLNTKRCQIVSHGVSEMT